MTRGGPAEELAWRGLLPARSGPAAHVAAVPLTRRRDSARGALLGTAIGDALGRPAERRRPSSIRGHESDFRDFQRWPGWQRGPVGTVTDDTQMTMCVAGCLVKCGGRIEPVDLAQRFVDWLPTGRAKGSTVVAAVERLGSGEPWWRSGERSAGNGAAMRVAPIGIALGGDTPSLSFDAAISAVITHADPMAVAGAVGHAWLIARLAAEQPERLNRDALIADLAAAVSVIDDPGAPEREWQTRARKSGQPVRLADRIGEVPRLLALPAHDAFDYFYNGAFVLETVPSALWCFLRFLDDPEEGVVTAVLGGHDADTVASMTGAYFGALHGEGAFPARWNGDDLEFRSELRNLADQLVALPGRPAGGAP